MVGRLSEQSQRELFRPRLRDMIDMKHELARLADRIDWSYFETAFSPLYAKVGQPAVPIRLMTGVIAKLKFCNHPGRLPAVEADKKSRR